MAIDWKDFKGTAKRLDDIDLPRRASAIGVGEDEMHMLIDVETTGSGFDGQGRPKMLFEPHIFYRLLSGVQLKAAVTQGLAYPKWGEKSYPKDSYPWLKLAMQINETAALKACSWGMGQILGENHVAAGYSSVTTMVQAMMEDEEYHLVAMINFIKASGIDDDLRRLAALKRPTTADDCREIARVYNGPKYAVHDYHGRMAKAHNKWRGIKDTTWDQKAAVIASIAPKLPPITPDVEPVTSANTVVEKQARFRQILIALFNKLVKGPQR